MPNDDWKSCVFFDKHDLAATRDAFGVSRRTLYRRQATLKAQGGNPAALAAKSSAPKKRSPPNTDPRLASEIRRLRTLYPNLSKVKLHVLLKPWCAQHGIALPSVSTIERIRDGMRRYIVTFIDPVLHVAFAVGLPFKHARYTARALDQGRSLLPRSPRTMLSENGHGPFRCRFTFAQQK